MSSFVNLSRFKDKLHPNLVQYLESEKAPDVSISYADPEILDLRRERTPPKFFPLHAGAIHLPCRISQALIPYHDDVKQYILTQDRHCAVGIHSHHYSHLTAMFDTIRSTDDLAHIRHLDVTFSINQLKKLAKCDYSTRSELVRLFSATFAKFATEHELSLVAMKDVTYPVSTMHHSSYYSLLVSLNRLRMMITSNRLGENGTVLTQTEEARQSEDENGKYTLHPNFVYTYIAKDPINKFTIIGAGQHFAIWHRDYDLLFIGSATYLDYMYTIADVCDNLLTIISLPNYSWLEEIGRILLDLAESDVEHNSIVNFMKTYESYILLLADYDPDNAMNWKPFLDITEELWKMDCAMSESNYEYTELLATIQGDIGLGNNQTVLLKLTVACKKLTRLQLMEISALHKFIFYAEVDSTAGIKKFLKRVHTKRAIDKDAVKNIVRLAKREFIVAYAAKHNCIPTIKGSHIKYNLIQELFSRHRLYTLEVYPLSWWDEITIWNCMENISTNDALEFAKDKGALKTLIRHGPGDSRKELLQVIEQEDNSISDFFTTRVIKPLQPRVTREYSNARPTYMTNPCRLIEKEREQKVEARLFANAELKNKHSLSVVALKAKKVLSYFTEQLMTPSDKTRKELIHSMAQELLQPDRYSMLLDIEGHNQSMQQDNTSELCEFIGNLYGCTGWGDLPNYFSMLHVYHYDEYTDNVITSEGQLGGIEGWLNPVWTLHTTLMMKLLRIMEDVELISLAVYSDDVNGIFSLKQASESSIQALFEKITRHCLKFGMIVKISQTALSKHRVTMLRQHYADGRRADSTLKRILAVSSANNQHLFSEELEVSGISSSSSSALELSNNHEVCAYIKNYKCAMLLARLPHNVLRMPIETGMLSESKLPINVGALIYQERYKDIDTEYGAGINMSEAVYNDMISYCNLIDQPIFKDRHNEIISELYRTPIARARLKDSGERMLYYQLYDCFLQELLFFWIYVPTSLGGLGGSLHINLTLSGHSSGFMKSIYYLHRWIVTRSKYKVYFLSYLEQLLAVDLDNARNTSEVRLLSTAWPSDNSITSASTHVSNSIRSMIIQRARNESVKRLILMSTYTNTLQLQMIEVFRHNFHSRIAQFYHENSSVHFLDLLLNKVETSSGLLTFVRKVTRLKLTLASLTYRNIRHAASRSGTVMGSMLKSTDITQYLINRREKMFSGINIIPIDEPLYDHRMVNSLEETMMIQVRKTSPSHYDRGIEVYDNPDIGNETLYKGDLIDNNRMLGNRLELITAKLCAVTKWLLTKNGILDSKKAYEDKLDIVKACDLSLQTLCDETLATLWKYSPTETGGEILHRIPNLRFSTKTYVRSEMNLMLKYTTDIMQKPVNDLQLYDSNINFDYLRLRLKVAVAMREKTPERGNLVVRYRLADLTAIHDVQHINAAATDHIPSYEHPSYSRLFDLSLITKRLRYMASVYLYTEDIEDLAIGPNLSNEEQIVFLGTDFVDDLIYNYAQDLNRNSILHDYSELVFEPWQPIIKKMKLIDKQYEPYDENQMLGRIRDGIIRKTRNKVRLKKLGADVGQLESLQKMMLAILHELRPIDKDIEAALLVVTSKFKLINSTTEYRAALKALKRARRTIHITVLCDYAIRLLLEIHCVGTEWEMDIDNTMAALKCTEVSSLLTQLLDPCLGIYITLFGVELINRDKRYLLDEIRDVLIDISLESKVLDIVLPLSKQVYKEGDPLPVDVPLPLIAKDVTYELREVVPETMRTLHQLNELTEYASVCSKSGAHPSVFTSPTGSDSYCAQYGLFKALMVNNYILHSTRICDLTAGRGDMQYVSNVLGLKTASFGIRDTFSKIYYHPNVDYTKEYDIFRTTTTKFIAEYNWVHIDVSFTGSVRPNILDIVLQCESYNLGYSIRLNSVTLDGYSPDIIDENQSYRHFIAYANASQLKPYHIYLIGVPTNDRLEYPRIPCKQSVAFRSLALSFTRLLLPSCHYLRSGEVECNSATIGIDNHDELSRFMKNMLLRESIAEHKFYLRRYVNTAPSRCQVMIVLDKIPQWAKVKLKLPHGSFIDQAVPTYNIYTNQDIGPVSENSRPYHEQHLLTLQKGQETARWIDYSMLDIPNLQVLRAIHPIKYVRSLMNTVINIRLLMPKTDLKADLKMELEKFEEKCPSDELKHVSHLDYRMAVKLLLYGASKGDYQYTVQYALCKIAISTKDKPKWTRIYRLIRLLSAGFQILVDDIQTGMFDLRHINAIVHSLEIGHENEILPRMITRIRRAKSEYPKPIFTNFDVDFTAFADAMLKQSLVTAYDEPPIQTVAKLEDGSWGNTEPEKVNLQEVFSQFLDGLEFNFDAQEVTDDIYIPEGEDPMDYL